LGGEDQHAGKRGGRTGSFYSQDFFLGEGKRDGEKKVPPFPGAKRRNLKDKGPREFCQWPFHGGKKRVGFGEKKMGFEGGNVKEGPSF